MNRKFDLVIFDCDGVLVDSEPVVLGVLTDYLNELGAELSVEDTTRIYLGKSVRDDLALSARVLGRQPPEGFFEEFRKRRDVALESRVEAIPHVREAILALPVPYCTASGADLGKMQITLGRTGLLPLFEGRMFSLTHVKRSKPAPDVYLLAAQTMGVPPERCAVVEDSPTGITAGLAAGMTVFGYCALQPAQMLLDAGAVAVFADMRNLRHLVP